MVPSNPKFMQFIYKVRYEVKSYRHQPLTTSIFSQTRGKAGGGAHGCLAVLLFTLCSNCFALVTIATRLEFLSGFTLFT